jgi:hypothetical protein
VARFGEQWGNGNVKLTLCIAVWVGTWIVGYFTNKNKNAK